MNGKVCLEWFGFIRSTNTGSIWVIGSNDNKPRVKPETLSFFTKKINDIV